MTEVLAAVTEKLGDTDSDVDYTHRLKQGLL